MGHFFRPRKASSAILALSLLGFWYCFLHSHFPDLHIFTRPPRELFLIVPVDKKAAGRPLCQVLLSAVVHGYVPYIVNWEKKGDRSFLHQAKISGQGDFFSSSTFVRCTDPVALLYYSSQ